MDRELSKKEKAVELVKLTNIEKDMVATIKSYLELIFENEEVLDYGMARLSKVKTLMEEYCIELYLEMFTDKELDILYKFYTDPDSKNLYNKQEEILFKASEYIIDITENLVNTIIENCEPKDSESDRDVSNLDIN